MKHALLSPSASSRWLRCTASVKLTKDIENKSNNSSTLGTNIHFIGEQLLKDVNIKVNQTLINENNDSFICDQSMLDEATNYCNYVKELIKNENSELIIEKKVDISYLYPKNTNIDKSYMFGHADAVVINEDILHIVDLKTGYNLVSATDNSQLKIYAYGVYNEISYLYDFKTIRLHIVQNNERAGYNNNIFDITVEDLENWVNKEVIPKSKEALSDNPTFKAGEIQCKWCLANSFCKTANDEANNLLLNEFDKLDEKASIEDILKFKEKFEFLNNLLKAYDDRLIDELQNGRDIENYKLVQKTTRKKWVNELDSFNELKEKFNEDDIAPRKMLTPTQIEKMLQKEDKEEFKKHYFKPEGQITIAKKEDKRKEVVSIVNEFDKF